MNIETAYSILKDLQIPDNQLKLIYEMINKNVNNFKVICDSYKLNSFDFFIIFKLIKSFNIINQK